MNDVEHKLRSALRPVPAPEGFAERVMRALPERPVVNVVPLSIVRNVPRAGAWRRFSTPAALAASLVLAVFGGRHVAVQHMEAEERAGLAASRELMQALRVTSQKLDVAYEAVQRPAPPKASPEQENRS